MKVAESPTRRRPFGSEADLVADMIGLLLLCVAAAWTFVSALISRSDPLAVLILFSALAVGTVSGRVAPRVAPMVVLGSAALLLVADPVSFVSRDATSFAFDYENAKGAFLVQVAAAGIFVAGRSRAQGLRTAAITGAIVFAVSPLIFGSVAAGILALSVVGVGAIATRFTRPASGALVLALAGILLVTVASTIVVGGAYPGRDDSAVVGGAVDATLSERRRLLWVDAVDALQGDPVFGVGPGNFERTSALAWAEEDVRWVPSVFLEQGAEAGVPGLALVLLILLWGLARLLVGHRPGWLIATGAVALFALGLHASIDYILHFPIVPLAAGAIFGSATSAAWERDV